MLGAVEHQGEVKPTGRDTDRVLCIVSGAKDHLTSKNKTEFQ